MSALAPLSGPERGAVRLRQPWLWRVQQALSNYLPLALMALLAIFTTWLVRQTPALEGPSVERPVRSTPDYEMRGFELQRFAAGGASQAWLRGAALRHYPNDDRIEIDHIELRLQDAAGGWLLAEAERALGPESGEWLRLTGEVRVRRFAPEVRPDDAAPALMELRTRELLAERDGRRLSSRSATTLRSVRLQGRVAGFQYEHGSGRLQFSGPSHFEVPATARP